MNLKNPIWLLGGSIASMLVARVAAHLSFVSFGVHIFAGFNGEASASGAGLLAYVILFAVFAGAFVTSLILGSFFAKSTRWPGRVGVGTSVALLLIWAPPVIRMTAATSEPGSSTESEMANLGSDPAGDLPAATDNSIAGAEADQARLEELVAALEDPSSEARDRAAREIRRLIRKYPSGTTNLGERDGGEARWKRFLAGMEPGMPFEDAIKLMATKQSAYRNEYSTMGGFGTSMNLDDSWQAGLGARIVNWDLDPNTPNGPTVLGGVNGPFRGFRSVVAPAPESYFTGVWREWYTNGTPFRDTEYLDGQRIRSEIYSWDAIVDPFDLGGAIP